MDLFSLVVSVVGVAIVPMGFTAKKLWDIDARLSAHEAADAKVFESIHTTLRDLKNGQERVDEKLDRLIERFL
jgi:hypothetical protein